MKNELLENKHLNVCECVYAHDYRCLKRPAASDILGLEL